MQPGIGFIGRALEPGDDATDRADQVAILRQRGFRGYRARAAAAAMGFGTRLQVQRDRWPIRPVQRFVATGRTLRPPRDAMMRTHKRADVHRDHPFVDRGRRIQHQPFDDLCRDQSVERFEYRRLRRERLESAILPGHVAQEPVHFLVVAQAAGEASPAGSFPIPPKDRPEERFNATRPHQHPRRSRLEMAPIHVGKTFCKIVIAHEHGERGVVSPHAGTGRFQGSNQLAVVTDHRDARRRQPLFDPARRGAKGGPVGRPVLGHAVAGGNDIALRGERHNSRVQVGGGMAAIEGGDDFGSPAPTVEQWQQIAIQAAVQQRIERFGNQERLLLADDLESQVRGQRGTLNEALVGGGGSHQDPAPGLRVRPGS